MFSYHIDFEYEVIRQRNKDLIRETELLRRLHPPKPEQPAVRRQLSRVFHQALLKVGRLFGSWGIRRELHYSAEKKPPPPAGKIIV